MMQLAFLIDRMWGSNGGTEGQLLMLLRHLDPQRFSVHLICLRDTDWLRQTELPYPVKVLSIGSLTSPSMIKGLWALRTYLRRHRINLVQTYFDDAYIVGALAGALTRVPVISCRRNLGPSFWGKTGYLRIFRYLHRYTSLFLTNSEATKRTIGSTEGIPPEKITVIYNGLDLDRFIRITDAYRSAERSKVGLREEHVLIGMISHLRREKNLELFVRAAAQVYSKFPETRFVIVGEGGYRSRLEQLIAEYNLTPVMCLPGAVDDIVPLLATFDIAVLTSDGESFSNAVIEYLAAGLPAVGTAVGGTVEALKENGFLFPPGDLNKLVQVLTYLIGNKHSRLVAGMNGRTEATRKYNISRMVTAHEEIYSTYLPGKD